MPSVSTSRRLPGSASKDFVNINNAVPERSEDSGQGLLKQSLLLALCLAWLAGCHSAPTQVDLGPPYEPITEARADALMPLDVLNREPGVVRVTDNRGENEKPDTSTPIAPDTWQLRVADYWIVDVTRSPDGAILITNEAELPEGQRVEYLNPLPMLPETLTLGEPLQSTTPINVYNHGPDSDALLTSGQCTQTLTLLGTRTINTPDGQITATLIQTQRKYKLPLVSVDIYILTAYVPGQGPAAGINRRVIRFLGLLPVTIEQHIMRIR